MVKTFILYAVQPGNFPLNTRPDTHTLNRARVIRLGECLLFSLPGVSCMSFLRWRTFTKLKGHVPRVARHYQAIKKQKGNWSG
jgi:hypothetical protein